VGFADQDRVLEFARIGMWWEITRLVEEARQIISQRLAGLAANGAGGG
jgi:hypothetical protein